MKYDTGLKWVNEDLWPTNISNSVFLINPLSTNPTKWSNTLKQFGNHFVVLELKGLSKGSKISKYVIFM